MDENNPHIALIIKHLTGDASTGEEQQLFDWIKENTEHQELFDQTKKVWELSHSKLDPEIAAIDLDKEWSLFEKNTGLASEAKVIQLNNTKQQKFGWLQIAAIIAFLIAVGGGILYHIQPAEIELTAQTNILENKLPDGSDIVLNAQSKLIYDEYYNTTDRKVKLEGTAYFEVTPDKTKPFIVETENITVKVLGTSFLVKNSASQNKTEVIVKTGRVLVYLSDNESDSVVLHAGERTSFDSQTNQLNKSENTDENFLSWKTKILNFNNKSLSEVVATLNDVYQSNITISNEELKHCTVTVGFDHQSIESVLTVLKGLVDITITKKGNKITISGKGCKNEKVN